MIIDMHVHIGSHYTHYEDYTRALRKYIEQYGIERIYISAVELDPFIGAPDAETLDWLNADAYRFAEEYAERVSAYVYENPLLPDALDRLKHGVEEHHACGMKLWVSTFCDDRSVDPLTAYCIDNNLPILVHCAHKSNGQAENESLSQHVARYAERFPEAKIVMAHLGGDAYLSARTVRDLPNVYTDCSGSLYRGGELEYMVRLLGSERVLFGSDMPYVPYSINIGKVLEANLTDDEKQNILYKNALRLFNGKESLK